MPRLAFAGCFEAWAYSVILFNFYFFYMKKKIQRYCKSKGYPLIQCKYEKSPEFWYLVFETNCIDYETGMVNWAIVYTEDDISF